MLHRFVLLIASLMAALALAAAPAFGGESTTTTTPSGTGAGTGAGAGAAPVGGVSTGAGGTVDQGSSALELGLGGAAVFLTIATGGFVLRRRLAGESS
jgi:hypothetical protein